MCDDSFRICSYIVWGKINSSDNEIYFATITKKDEVKTMKKKLKVFKRMSVVFVMSTAFMLTACSYETANTETIPNTYEVSDEIESKKVLVSEAVANAQADYDAVKKTSKKFTFLNIKPYCNELTTVSDIERFKLGNYKGITDAKEMYDEQMKLVHYYLGDDLNIDCFRSDYYADIPTDKYKSFTEYREALENGEKLDISSLGYIDQSIEDIKYVEMHINLSNISFYRGNVYNSIPLEVKQMADTPATQARFLCEDVATYYVNNQDQNLNDRYMLKNGEMSIREGIDFVENYLNNELGIEDSNPDVKLKVAEVSVFKVYEGCYCYWYKVTREICGLPKTVIDPGTLQKSTMISADMSEAYMIYTDEVDMYFGNTRRFEYKKKNEIDKILPLSAALEIIFNNIGENSSYAIKNIMLGYMDVRKDYSGNGDMEVAWIVETTNEQDERGTTFYVNATTGKITVVY